MARIGLMGCGVVAGYGHLPVIKSIPQLDLAAVYDPDISRARAAAEKYSVPCATDNIQTFFGCGLDAVTITSPAPAHVINACDAARHGAHILCEKPLAMTEKDGRRMIDVAAQAGVMLFTGFDYRFSPAAMRIKQLIAEQAIGEVRSLRLVYIWGLHGKYEPGPDGGRRLNARRVGRMEEGGPMVDCGVHQIDLARWWLGSDVRHAVACGAWVEDYAAPDHIYLHMDHDNGAHTMVEISFSFCHTCQEPRNRFTYELIGTDGVILYDRQKQLFEVRNSQGTEQLEFSPEKNFAGMYAAFSHALKTGDCGHLPTGQDGLAALVLSRHTTDALIAQRQAAVPNVVSLPD